MALPPGIAEVKRFETSRFVIFNSVRQGFAAAYDSLVIDPALRGQVERMLTPCNSSSQYATSSQHILSTHTLSTHPTSSHHLLSIPPLTPSPPPFRPPFLSIPSFPPSSFLSNRAGKWPWRSGQTQSWTNCPHTSSSKSKKRRQHDRQDTHTHTHTLTHSHTHTHTLTHSHTHTHTHTHTLSHTHSMDGPPYLLYTLSIYLQHTHSIDCALIPLQIDL